MVKLCELLQLLANIKMRCQNNQIEEPNPPLGFSEKTRFKSMANRTPPLANRSITIGNLESK